MKLLHLNDKTHEFQIGAIARVYDDVIKLDVYKLKELIKSPLANQIKTVIDIGANVGYFSTMSCCLLPDARKIAIEPDLWSYELLCENLTGWDVQGFRVALGQSNVRMVSLHNKNSSVEDECVINDNGDIPSMMLSEMLQRFEIEPTGLVLKLDCEGGEWCLLYDDDLKKWLDAIYYIVVEVHFKFGTCADWMNWATVFFKGMSIEMRETGNTGIFSAKRW